MTANPTLLSMPLAQNGQKNVIPETQATAGDGLFSQSTGFPAETSLPLGAGGVAPSREDFNGMANLLGGVAYYAQKGWQFQFDAAQDYYAGCIVRDTTDGKLYECINDVAAGGSVPSADSTNWKAFSTGGLPVGFIAPYAGTGLAEGWLDCDGSAVSRTMYPDLFDAIGTTWGAGDGSTTFNLPRSEDLVMQGASATNPVGTYKQAGLPNITGTTGGVFDQANAPDPGAFADTGIRAGGIAGTYNTYFSSFDASRSSAIYGNSDTVQPPAACVRFMIKAFDGQTPDSALIDITQYAADLANKATRSLDNLTQTGEDHFLEQDFAIIYPNGGSEGNPANVTTNSLYLTSNPFPGYYVACSAEIYFSNSWHEVALSNYFNSTAQDNQNCGMVIGQEYDGNIALRTGLIYIASYIGQYATTAVLPPTVISTVPCRIRVWKIGKIPS